MKATKLQQTPEGGSLRRRFLDGMLVEEYPVSLLPVGNACNHCVLKGTPCYDRTDVCCDGDAREDGVEVVFRKAQNVKLTTEGLPNDDQSK